MILVKIKEIIFRTVATTKLIKVRYFKQRLPSAILIYRDNVATYIWSANPSGVVIRSQAIAKRYNVSLRKSGQKVKNKQN